MSRLRTNVAFAAFAVAAILVSIAVLSSYLASAPSASTVRLGYFPNMTHATAVYGVSHGDYQRALTSLNPDIRLQPIAFNAGPTAIQALLSNQVDLVFVGPSPTLSGLAVAGPDVLRVIAGASSGGALFVVQPELHLTSSADYAGRKFATPQLGNTQDVALKHYLFALGHTTRDRGGDVDVINVANPFILSLFRQRQIDGAWVPEPWATRLLREASGKVLLDERDLWAEHRFVTTHLVTTKRYLDAHHDIVTSFLEAHVNVTLNLQDLDSAERGIINAAIANLTGIHLEDATVEAAFRNLNITYDPIGPSLETYLDWAQDLDFISAGVSASALYDMTILDGILEARGLPPVGSE